MVLEQFQTDTADYADFVLPATTFLEHTDLYLAYGHYYLQLARPAVARPGETRSNVDVFRALAARMGFDDPCFADSEDDMLRTLLDSEHPFVRGITLEQLDRDRFVRLKVAPQGQPFLPFAAGGFGTPSGKCEFHAESIAYTPPAESRWGDESLRARFPLEMISPKHDDSMNSTFGYRPENDAATGAVHLATADAAARGIVTGDQVRVYNDRGSCLLRADVDGVVKPGVVSVPSVRWARMAADHQSVNALTAERLTDKGGGPDIL